MVRLMHLAVAFFYFFGDVSRNDEMLMIHSEKKELACDHCNAT